MQNGTTCADNAKNAKKSRQNDKNNELTQFWKLTIVARWLLLISGPRVRVPGDAPNFERKIVRFGVFVM